MLLDWLLHFLRDKTSNQDWKRQAKVEHLWAAVSLMLLELCIEHVHVGNVSGSVSDKNNGDCHTIPQRKQKQKASLNFKSCFAGDSAQTRYQSVKGKDAMSRFFNNISGANRKPLVLSESQTDQEAAYVQPICADYYNCGQFIRPPSEDSLHYQNVAGPSNGSQCGIADVGIYENSAALVLFQAPPESESSSDDEEADYINAGPGLVPKSR
uniref:Uncharacterized protein n=1 Tax=Sphaerodactylus townsendi TaxID=933632 RepID=A0ACB8EDP7_9SAUR